MKTLIKMSLKLLLRTKAFWFFLILTPVLSTLVLKSQFDSSAAYIQKDDGRVIELSGADEKVAYNGGVNLADENLADFGRPTFATKTINTLSGYIKCAEAHPAIDSALSSELKQIESYMLGGFFWE